MTQSLTAISKFLSYILRHKPDAIGLNLDPEGWASIQELIDRADIPITPQLLHEVVATSDKKRFAISNDGLFIRANQGHSLAIDLGLKPIQPPQYLYHGTATHFLDSIKMEGLLPKRRQYVHLSADKQTAVRVGQRHGTPIVLVIATQNLHEQGHLFFQADNGVWLTSKVEPKFIQSSSAVSAIT
jgi:putative RNA 2'-phosphotransferase